MDKNFIENEFLKFLFKAQHRAQFNAEEKISEQKAPKLLTCTETLNVQYNLLLRRWWLYIIAAEADTYHAIAVVRNIINGALSV